MIVDNSDELWYIVVMLGELYVDVNYYVICYMVNSPLHVCGCGFHLWWPYNLCYTGVDVDADTIGET